MWERIEKFYTHLYDFVMVVCKVLLLIDVGITTLAVMGRYIPFVPPGHGVRRSFSPA